MNKGNLGSGGVRRAYGFWEIQHFFGSPCTKDYKGAGIRKGYIGLHKDL